MGYQGYKKTKDGRFVPNEESEQSVVFDWAARQSCRYPELSLLYHIPNEGKRSPGAGARLKAMGLKSGVPDICLPAARGNYHGLYIELKAQEGAPTTAQTDFLIAVRKQGYCSYICFGAEKAIEIIREYLELGKYRREE
jgi:hypothetical protein